ncbi:MAG: hypothetical protein GY795_44645 [Desulfobacterales bacterium]|nr:hypothetical protein [Desulfobacterales bacterium]
MDKLVNIDGKTVSSDQFIKFLKLSNEFPGLIGRFISGKITVHAAKKKGIKVTIDEIQRAADDFRRCSGLHLARDTREWMKLSGITSKEFESFITEHVYKKKLVSVIVNNDSVEQYFMNNSTKFDTANIKRITIESEERAIEIMEMLAVNPERFEAVATEDALYEVLNSTERQVSTVQRFALSDATASKVFNAKPGDIIGPFQQEEGDMFEIVKVISLKEACLDDSTEKIIAEAIYEEWVEERLKEHNVLF